jgi:hypothetical protein
VAAPEELRATELHPLRSPLPSLNATSPDGVPEAEETVAVNVTLWPADTGLGETETVVVVAVVLELIIKVTPPPEEA